MSSKWPYGMFMMSTPMPTTVVIWKYWGDRMITNMAKLQIEDPDHHRDFLIWVGKVYGQQNNWQEVWVEETPGCLGAFHIETIIDKQSGRWVNSWDQVSVVYEETILPLWNEYQAHLQELNRNNPGVPALF